MKSLMNFNSMNPHFLAKILVGLLTSGLFAQTGWAAATPNHKLDRKVVLACARANNIVLPKANTLTISASQKLVIHNCVRTYRINLKVCAQKSGVSGMMPQNMSNSQVIAYRQCEAQALSQIR